MSNVLQFDSKPLGVIPPVRSQPLERPTASTEPDGEDDDDLLPPVFQFPIVATVRATFVEAGRLEPLMFPEVDD